MKPISYFSIVNILISSFGVLLALGFLFLLFISNGSSFTDISILLTYNTYLALLMCCISLLIFHAHTLYRTLNPLALVATPWCHISFYFGFSALCALYFSYVLQAFFRLLRIAFYRKRSVQSFRFFFIFIVIQWVLAFLVALPSLLVKQIVYIPNEYNCQIQLNDILGFFSLMLIIYLIPTTVILSIYGYILRFIRLSNHLRSQRKNAAARDVVVLKRIVILSLSLIILGQPAFWISVIYWSTNYLVPMAYNIRDLAVVIGITGKIILVAFLTPQIREKLQQNRNRIAPFTVPITNQRTTNPNTLH